MLPVGFLKQPLLPYGFSLYCPVFRLCKGKNQLFAVGHNAIFNPLTPKTFGQSLEAIISNQERS
jgi:hypothetical protein